MMKFRVWSFITALLAGVAVLNFGNRLLGRHRAKNEQLKAQIADSKRQLAALRSQHDGTARDLSLAEQQLSRLAPAMFAVGASVPDRQEPANDSWVSRTQRLRALAAENSALVIPEMQLLVEEDWVRVALKAGFDTDAERREALAGLRNAAKEKFVRRLAPAAQKWALAEGADKVPASTLDLAGYIEPPIEPAMLKRYEIVSDLNASDSRPGWQVREAAPADEDYDKRYSVGSNGSFGSSGTGPLTWNEDYATRVRRAYKAYASANPGARPERMIQILPYVVPPLPPATVEKLLQAERKR